MSGSREEILANFQECTGIDNIEEAIMWLDDAQWELLTAINNALPQDEQMRFYDSGPDHSMETNHVPVSLSSDFIDVPSASSRNNILDILVHYQSKVYKLQVPDSMTVRCVKTLIFADTKVPVCQQIIAGWPSCSSDSSVSDNTILKELNMPQNTNLYLTTPCFTAKPVRAMAVDQDQEGNFRVNQPEAGDQISPSGSKEKNRNKILKGSSDIDNSELFVSLRVHDGNQNREHNLKIPRSQTVLDVKNEIVNLTGINMPEQTWLGWPENTFDSMKLYELKLDKPCHYLTVVRLQEEPQNPHPTTKQNIAQMVSSEDSDSEAESEGFDDAAASFLGEEGIFNDEVSHRNRIAPLMPDNVEDETIGSVSFIDGYTSRYGQASPTFFSGPLELAVNEALFKNGRDKRMLAIYLHHDGSILTNVFCSEILGSDAILPLLTTYFVLWGWDVTNPENRDMLLQSIHRNLGPSIFPTVSSIKPDDFPALVIVARFRLNIELLNVIRGNIGAQEFLNMLIGTVDIFTERLEAEIQSEEERAARDRIKFEQDMAYQESLILDKAKEESRKQQLLLKTQEEERIKKEEEQRAAEKLAVESRLPDEPNDDTSSKDVMTFRFRTPKGDFFIRKFRTSETLQTVFDYLLVQGFRIDDFKVISAFPRKDLSGLDASSLLKDLGLCAQETLILEAR